VSDDGSDPDAAREGGAGGLTGNGQGPSGGSTTGEPSTNGEDDREVTPGDGDPRAGTAPAAGSDSPWSFEEVQRFRQRWLWATIAVVSALAVATVLFRPTGPVVTALLLVLPAIGIPGTYLARLRTEVREDGLYVQLFPLHRSPRRVGFEDVTDQETVEFRAFRDYGGIGIRRTPDGWAYLVTGGGGVRVERGEGTPSVVVGSRRPDELERALAAGAARARTTVEGDDGPRWRAVADFQRSPGGAEPGEPGSGESADADTED